MTKSRELVKNSTLIQEGVDYWEEALSESVQASDVSDLEVGLFESWHFYFCFTSPPED